MAKTKNKKEPPKGKESASIRIQPATLQRLGAEFIPHTFYRLVKDRYALTDSQAEAAFNGCLSASLISLSRCLESGIAVYKVGPQPGTFSMLKNI